MIFKLNISTYFDVDPGEDVKVMAERKLSTEITSGFLHSKLSIDPVDLSEEFKSEESPQDFSFTDVKYFS